jgi:hypothetical protein
VVLNEKKLRKKERKKREKERKKEIESQRGKFYLQITAVISSIFCLTICLSESVIFFDFIA